MLKPMSFITALSASLMSSVAQAQYDGPFADTHRGISIFDPSVLMIGGLIVGVIICVQMYEELFGGSRAGSNASASSDTAEHYEQEAVRLRALARKLDAETVATESQLRAAIKSDELKEVKQLLGDSKSRRGR